MRRLMAMLVVGLMSACSSGTLTVTQPKTQEPPTAATADSATQSPLSSTAPSPLIGKWKGTWERDGRSFAGGPMEMEIETNEGDRLTGRVRFPDARNCSNLWEKLEGTKNGEKISAHYDIGGRCGKATLTLSVNLVKGVIVGTYSSEGAGNGDIRLTRQ